MDKLFEDKETFQKERPKHLPKSYFDHLCNRLANDYIDSFNVNKNIKDVIEDFKNLDFSDGGYEMAKNLEEKDYYIDLIRVEHLDFFAQEYDSVLRDLVKQWVDAHNITPKYKEGDKVVVKSSFSRIKKKDMELYVTRVYKDKAQYVVSDEKEHPGGFVYNYELLEAHTELINQ